jgi:hypothetical protein
VGSGIVFAVGGIKQKGDPEVLTDLGFNSVITLLADCQRSLSLLNADTGHCFCIVMNCLAFFRI